MQFEGEGWGRGKCSGVHKGSFNSWLRRLYESSWVISAVLWLQIQKHGPHPPKLPKTKGPLEDQLQTLVCLHILIVSWSSMIRSWYVLNMFWICFGDSVTQQAVFCGGVPGAHWEQLGGDTGWSLLGRSHQPGPFGTEGSTGDDDDVRCVHWCTLYTQCRL